MGSLILLSKSRYRSNINGYYPPKKKNVVCIWVISRRKLWFHGDAWYVGNRKNLFYGYVSIWILNRNGFVYWKCLLMYFCVVGLLECNEISLGFVWEIWRLCEMENFAQFYVLSVALPRSKFFKFWKILQLSFLDPVKVPMY